MARDDYSTIMIKKETKEIMDCVKKKTGKSLWFIMHEAVKEYAERQKKKRKEK